MDEIIRQAIERVAKGLVVKTVLVGTAINVTDTQCDVNIEGAPAKTDVVLNAIEGTLDSYVTVVPEEGSIVLIGVIENRKTDAFVISCSKVKKVIGKIGTCQFVIDENGYQISRGGENLKQLMLDLVQANLNATYTNGGGTTFQTNNYLEFQNIQSRIPNLLT